MIYFIYDDLSNAVKIGYTEDLEKRLSGLQTGNPRPLRVLMYIDGDLSREAEFHAEYADFRMEGEWFDASEQGMQQRLLELFNKQHNLDNGDSFSAALLEVEERTKMLRLMNGVRDLEKRERLNWRCKEKAIGHVVRGLSIYGG